MPLGRHTLPVQSAGQYPAWHPNWPLPPSLWAQHGQLRTVNFLSLWTSTPHNLACIRSLHLWERTCSTHSYPTQASLCHFVQIGFFQWGRTSTNCPQAPGPASHTVTYPSSLQTQTSELTGWWCVIMPPGVSRPSVLDLATHGVLDQMSAPAAAWLILTTIVPNLGSLLALSESRH